MSYPEIGEFVDDVFPVVPPRHHRVVKERHHRQILQKYNKLCVRKKTTFFKLFVEEIHEIEHSGTGL
jgi:hypothetical protein